MGLRKRIFLELFVTPYTMIPFIGGLSLLMLSEILGGRVALLGMFWCLFGFGVMVTNYLFRIEAATESAVRKMREEENAERNRSLDELAAKLDPRVVRPFKLDPRALSALVNLRALYDSFSQDMACGRIAYSVPREMLDEIDEVFETAVRQLERQHDVWETAAKVTGTIRDDLLRQRDEMLVEVEAAVTGLGEVINEVRSLRIKANRGELTTLKNRLASQLRVAKAVDQRMKEITGPANYDEYDRGGQS